MFKMSFYWWNDSEVHNKTNSLHHDMLMLHVESILRKQIKKNTSVNDDSHKSHSLRRKNKTEPQTKNAPDRMITKTFPRTNQNKTQPFKMAKLQTSRKTTKNWLKQNHWAHSWSGNRDNCIKTRMWTKGWSAQQDQTLQPRTREDAAYIHTWGWWGTGGKNQESERTITPGERKWPVREERCFSK